MKVRAFVCGVGLIGGACAPEPAPRVPDTVPDAAVRYLLQTDDEIGPDVALFARGYGEMVCDHAAVEWASGVLDELPEGQRRAFHPLLAHTWTPLPPARLRLWHRVGEQPPDTLITEDDRVRECLEQALTCDLSAECTAFLDEDAWGFVLTHQALVVVTGQWIGCTLPIDVDALRRRYAARLLVETEHDPVASDLFFERLAMLAALGYGQEIRPQWVGVLLASQHDDGCFPASADVECHPHPTALALWVIGVLNSSSSTLRSP